MDPVNADQIQFIFFGPGYGESILVHIGDNNWVIVDSCYGEYKGEECPVALAYLNSQGVNLETQVKLVLVSHWHEDHILGISRLVEDCKSAKFALPIVLDSSEYIAYLKAKDLQDCSPASFAGKELISCFKSIKKNGAKPLFAIQNRILLESSELNISHDKKVVVLALSPTDAQVGEFHSHVKDFWESNDKSSQFKEVEKLDKNEISTALLIEIDNCSVLLGSDVNYSEKSDRGWKSIIELRKNHSNKSKYYKVAHHGSTNSFSKDIWTQLLLERPVSILVPWSLMGNRLPTVEQIEKIKENSSEVYITSSGRADSSENILHTLNIGIDDHPKTIIDNKCDVGYIRLTIDINSNEHFVELANGAKKL